MARLRTIKPGFFTDDDLGELPPLARLLYAGLWCQADREGRLEDRPKRLKVEILPYDACDISALLAKLAERGLIVRYTVAGQRYIAIPTFGKHQNPHVKEAASTIPAPEPAGETPVQAQQEPLYKEDEHPESTGQALDEHGASTVQAGQEWGVGSGLGETLPLTGESAPAKPATRPARSASQSTTGRAEQGHLSNAVKAANVILHLRCDETQRAEVDRIVPATEEDQAHWEACLKEWRLRNHKPQLRGPLEWFTEGIPDAKPQRPGTNGQMPHQAPAPKPRPLPEGLPDFGPEGLQPAPRNWRQRGGEPVRLRDVLPHPSGGAA
jgi:hypothetical protein